MVSPFKVAFHGQPFEMDDPKRNAGISQRASTHFNKDPLTYRPILTAHFLVQKYGSLSSSNPLRKSEHDCHFRHEGCESHPFEFPESHRKLVVARGGHVEM